MRSAFVLLIAILFFLTSPLSAQVKTGTLKGKLVDSTSKQNLKNATISVIDKKDSSVITYGISKADGTFQIDDIPFGDHIFLVSFIGFNGIEKNFSVNATKPQYNTGTLYLFRGQGILPTVVIKAAPIAVNGDTTEFNASQYKTIPNATTEDLLKKLPSVEVDKDGTITAQGTTVTRVLVDGKRFFGDDPKMATRNLPADIIDKIQVIDALSDQSAFSGFDDGDRVKTINIITKKDRRKGVFGKAVASVGDNGRYSESLSLNRFNGNQQFSFIGQTNNINSQNFSIQDFLGSINTGGGGGRGNRVGGGGGGTVSAGLSSATKTNGGISTLSSSSIPGLSTTLAAGFNYNDVWGKKTQVNGSYFYNTVNTSNNSDRDQETFVTNDSSLFNTNNLISQNNNKNNRVTFEINHMFDSSNSLLIRPNYSYQETNNSNETNSYTSKGVTSPLSNINSNVTSQSQGYNFTNSILFRHKFKKPGTTFSINFTQAFNSNDRNGTNLSYDNYYSRGMDTINQVSTTDRDGKSYGANVSFTQGIGKKSQLELTYNYNHNQNNSDQRTFQMDNVTGKEDIVVPNLTNLFQNTNISNRGGINYRMQLTPSWTYSIGMAVQDAALTSNNLTTNVFLHQTFINLFPNFNIQYRKVRAKNFRFSYRGSTVQPSISQLQDVIDNSDVLNIKSGNPALKQEFDNNFNLNYTAFNISTFKNLSVNISGNIASNKIENATIINTSRDSILVEGYKLSPGAQFSKPQNLNGAFNVSTYINYGFPIKTSKINMNLTGRLNYIHDVSLLNNVKVTSDNYVPAGTVRLNMNLNERFDLNFTSTSTFNIVKYSTDEEQSSNYFTQHFIAEPTYSSKSGWILSTDLDYTINTGQAAGYNQAIPLWNAGLAKLFGKKKNVEVRFSVFDILNENKSITRDVEPTYIEDIRSQVLNRYFLVAFTWNIKNFKGQAPGGNGRRGPGNFKNFGGNPSQFRNRN